jgi:thymidylate kinase
VKIAFIGTHGIGKTTLCFELAARLKRLDISVDIVKEVARSCPLPINQQTTLLAQSWILHTQIAAEIAASSRFEAIICDRSVIDNYAYLVHRVGPRPSLEALIQEWAASYDGLFKVPICSAPTFDGTRDLSATFQQEIDQLLEETLRRMQIRCTRLDPQRRFHWISEVLRRLGLPERAPQYDLFGVERQNAASAGENPDDAKPSGMV